MSGRGGYGTREWEWDPSHFPLPLTPSFASVYPGWMERAFRTMFAEFGFLALSLDARLCDGYLFVRARPVGMNRTPPPRIAAVALRLWWVHPDVRRRVRRAVKRVREDHSGQLLRRWEREWRPRILLQQRAARTVDLTALSDAALADHLAALCRRVGGWVTIHFLLHAAISIPVVRLQEFLAAHPPLADVRVHDLLQGHSRASSAPARALEQAAAPLRDMPELVARAGALPPSEAVALLRQESLPFREAFGHYLSRFGQGIVSRYDFASPTLAEQPQVVLSSLLRSARGGASREDESATQRLNEAARRLRDAGTSGELRRLAGSARRAYSLRDDNVHLTFTEAFGLVRLVLLDVGRRLARRGALASADDVFFLEIDEVLSVLRGRTKLRFGIASVRRAEWRAACKQRPPRAFGRKVQLPPLDALPAEARLVNEGLVLYLREIMATPDIYAEPAPDSLEVRGVPAVRGRYVGIARIVRGEADFDRLTEGDVLVCPMTSPAWAALLPLAGALVTDHGGTLSHAAVIAREFGIPAVVATMHGTTVIPDGATVEVDGDAGTVRVVSS